MSIISDYSMPINAKAFYLISFFVIGVFLASFINTWNQKILVSVLVFLLVACLLSLFLKYWFAILSFGIILGSGYYFIFDFYGSRVNLVFGEKIIFTGIIHKVSAGGESQNLVIETQEPYKGRIKASLNRYPAWEYGDLVKIEGTIKMPSPESGKYLEKDGIFGTLSFPKIELIEHNRGSYIKAKLFKIKDFADGVFKKALSPKSASLLSGITLGETSGFSREFRDKMSLTGTSHLVALSGYNISVVAKGVMLVLGFWFSRRKIFYFSTLTILLFILMTGAESSAVRAGVMAFLVLFAEQSGRVYSPKNAIAVAAFLMILFNPKILVWDIGFQLSFLAVVGLIYLRPVLSKILRLREDSGFMNWRENFWTTVAVQIAVLPVLFINFGFFAPLSLLVNVLILGFVPVTMFLGFILFLAGSFSDFLGLALGWLVNLFLSYITGVINLFSRFDLRISADNFSIWFAAFYYCLLFVGVIYVKNKKYGLQKS